MHLKFEGEPSLLRQLLDSCGGFVMMSEGLVISDLVRRGFAPESRTVDPSTVPFEAPEAPESIASEYFGITTDSVIYGCINNLVSMNKIWGACHGSYDRSMGRGRFPMQVPFSSIWQVARLYAHMDALLWKTDKQKFETAIEHFNSLLADVMDNMFGVWLPAFMQALTQLRAEYLADIESAKSLQNKIIASVASAFFAMVSFLSHRPEVHRSINTLWNYTNYTR